MLESYNIYYLISEAIQHMFEEGSVIKFNRISKQFVV